MARREVQKTKEGTLERALQQLASRLRRQQVAVLSKAPLEPLHLGPASAFEALLQERMSTLEHSVEEVKARVNGLIFLVVGAVLTQLLVGLLT